ncbi:unnamed protein product [Cochlearia groenlandica]
MDRKDNKTLQVVNGSLQDISPMDGDSMEISMEITEELSPNQQQRCQRDANGSLISSRFKFSPMSSPRISRRVGSMSPSSSSRHHKTTLKNLFNFKNRNNNNNNNNNAYIEEGVSLVFDKSSYIPRTWSLTNLLAPIKSSKTDSLPVTPLAHSNPESMHGRYAADPVTSMKRERPLPIRRSRSVPALINKDGSVKSSAVFRVIPTPSHGDEETMHASRMTATLNDSDEKDVGEDVPEEEAVCRICMVELGEEEAFKMECMCKGELALAHRKCTIKWFTIKGNIACDVCKQDVKNLPVTLLRVQELRERAARAAAAEHNTEVSEFSEWQDVPILVTVSMLAYFCFLEQLLVAQMKNTAIAISLPFSCIIGLLASMISTTMVKKKYVWIFATVQFVLVVFFAHVFYAVVKQPVMCIVLATMIGFGLTMSGTSAINEYMKWRRSNAHQTPEPVTTQMGPSPFPTA